MPAVADLYIKVEPAQINFINRIMEGYEYFGVVTTVQREQGILVVRCTPDTIGEVQVILQNLPVAIEYIAKP